MEINQGTYTNSRNLANTILAMLATYWLKQNRGSEWVMQNTVTQHRIHFD